MTVTVVPRLVTVPALATARSELAIIVEITYGHPSGIAVGPRSRP
jgi:hypothetical protein